MRVEKKVRIIALEKRYRQNVYPFAVSFNQTTGEFMTGQDLSYEKMTGKTALIKSEKAALGNERPFIINPDNHYPLKHGRTFNISYDEDDKGVRVYDVAKDHAEFDFFELQAEVAKDKKSYKRGTHYFYIEDKEKEAEFQLIENDKCFEAESLMRNKTASGRYGDVIMLLNMYAPGYNLDPAVLSELQMKAHIIDACRKFPDVILMFGKKEVEEIVFAAKLVKHNIIERKNGLDFYYKGDFIGTTIESVREYLRDPKKAELVTKWAKQIESK
ncbi:MAG: hypothetical protein H8E51_08640 [Bacteroidetes bacterium]|nr:hypothetical protein [Bacteroidota bacterium]